MRNNPTSNCPNTSCGAVSDSRVLQRSHSVQVVHMLLLARHIHHWELCVWLFVCVVVVVCCCLRWVCVFPKRKVYIVNERLNAQTLKPSVVSAPPSFFPPSLPLSFLTSSPFLAPFPPPPPNPQPLNSSIFRWELNDKCPASKNGRAVTKVGILRMRSRVRGKKKT